MSKIYVPSFTDESCVHILDKDTIRVYDEVPQNDYIVTYTDYFINSHYISTSSLQTFNSTDIIPTCENINDITSDFYYRNDLCDILVSFLIISIVALYLPYKMFSRAFGRWFKL